jgi:uncharacterized protein (DUF1697 family)
MKKAIPYVVFLRGINMIGHKTVKMDEVKRIFEELEFENVKTVQASGNIVFESIATDNHSLITKIEDQLEKGHKVGVTLRTLKQLNDLIMEQSTSIRCTVSI